MTDYVTRARALIANFVMADRTLLPILSEIDLALQRHQEQASNDAPQHDVSTFAASKEQDMSNHKRVSSGSES